MKELFFEVLTLIAVPPVMFVIAVTILWSIA